MKITVNQCDFLDVTFEECDSNCGDNRDSYTFSIVAESQPILVNGVEMNNLNFTIVGNMELVEFFTAMDTIKKAINC